VLESASDTTDLLTLVSLRPGETISACASKMKGQVSKWLRSSLKLDAPADLLSRGYFACTVGRSTSEAVEQYLSLQSEHHGYAGRLLPPVFVEQFGLSAADEDRVKAKHAAVIAQFHLVLATCKRRGVFGTSEGRVVTAEWRKLQTKVRMALIKVSFVPDHVHIALRAHPAETPADLIVELMNAAQQVMSKEMIAAKIDRLWQPSAYLGSYGDLASPQIRKYIQNWTGESVAASVRLHGTSPWHLEFSRDGSRKRETPRDKPVAS
jgi:REP element-mobilizing transposase RayT